MKELKLPDSWRRSKGAIGHGGLISPKPSLVSSIKNAQSQEESELERQRTETRSKPSGTPRGLALHVEPKAPWRVPPSSPWAAVPQTTERIASHAQVAMLAGLPGDAKALALGISAESQRVKKPPTLLMRRLRQREEDTDEDEVRDFKGVVSGFVVPPYGSHDMALSFERTRRRVVELLEQALLSGWTKAPKIVLDAPNMEWVERLAKGVADFLIIKDPPRGANLPAPYIIVPVKQGATYWWRTTDNYLYSHIANDLWWEDWMVNPLTFPVESE